jgi:hypothetical protein
MVLQKKSLTSNAGFTCKNPNAEVTPKHKTGKLQAEIQRGTGVLVGWSKG